MTGGPVECMEGLLVRVRMSPGTSCGEEVVPDG